MAVAVAILGVVAAGFWLGEESGEVRVSYAGVSAQDSNVVVFTISNTAKTTMVYWIGAKERLAGETGPPQHVGWHSGGYVAGPGGTNCEMAAFSTNRWRLAVTYHPQLPDSFEIRAFHEIGQFAARHHWERISEVVDPWRRWKITSSPTMLGNHPALTEPQ